MDAIYPGTFSLAKVKWGAKFDYEYMDNYKVLQNAFDKNGIKKHIDVDKMVKARYQDNLEFCQWIKRYFDLNYSGEPYNALQRRKGNNIFYIMGGNKVAPPSQKQTAM
jgi:RP/EB family microtubule-associated protein